MPWAGKKISDIGWPRAKLEKQNNFKQFHAAQVMSRGPPGSNSEKIWRQSTHGSRLKSELRWFRTRKSRSILKLDKEWQQVTTSCKVCRFQMLSQVLSLLSVGNWSPHVDAKTYKTNPFGTDMFFFLLLISYIARCSAFTRLSAWSGNCICSPEVSSPRLRCEKKRSYHILESCLSACSLITLNMIKSR